MGNYQNSGDERERGDDLHQPVVLAFDAHVVSRVEVENEELLRKRNRLQQMEEASLSRGGDLVE